MTERAELERLAAMCEDQAEECDRMSTLRTPAPEASRWADEAADWRTIAQILRATPHDGAPQFTGADVPSLLSRGLDSVAPDASDAATEHAASAKEASPANGDAGVSGRAAHPEENCVDSECPEHGTMRSAPPEPPTILLANGPVPHQQSIHWVPIHAALDAGVPGRAAPAETPEEELSVRDRLFLIEGKRVAMRRAMALCLDHNAFCECAGCADIMLRLCEPEPAVQNTPPRASEEAERAIESLVASWERRTPREAHGFPYCMVNADHLKLAIAALRAQHGGREPTCTPEERAFLDDMYGRIEASKVDFAAGRSRPATEALAELRAKHFGGRRIEGYAIYNERADDYDFFEWHIPIKEAEHERATLILHGAATDGREDG